MFYTNELKLDSMSKDLTSFKVWFAVGAAVLLIGLALQWYPTSVIRGMRERLTQSDITPEERTEIQYDLNPWEINQITMFQPLSLAFFTGGILILVYAVLSAIFSIASIYADDKKKEKE
jgi:hypothetical protein